MPLCARCGDSVRCGDEELSQAGWLSGGVELLEGGWGECPVVIQAGIEEQVLLGW